MSTESKLQSLKPSLSIKKGLESLSSTKGPDPLNLKKTITFATEHDEKSSMSSSQLKAKKQRKPSRKEVLAKIEAKYLSQSTISTLAKEELEKRFRGNEEEIDQKYDLLWE